MEHLLKERRRITPDQAVKILAEHGTKVTRKEAEMILDFMYKFAKLALSQYIKS
jgi:hypothetical protein